MRVWTIMATVLVAGTLVLAQVCPPSRTTTLVPSRATSTAPVTTVSMVPMTSTSMVPVTGISTMPMTTASAYPCPYPTVGANVYPYPMTGANVYPYPMTGVSAYPYQFPMTTMSPYQFPVAGVSAYPYQFPMTTMSAFPYTYPMTSINTASTMGFTGDTTAIVNELRSLRADNYANTLELRGQMLASRMDQLIANENAFRQQIATNPNWPDARFTALQLQGEASALNQDIAAFNTELSMVPSDLRPAMAQRLNTFDVAYWTPALQRFASFNTSFQQTASTAYQPAVATNPWLPTWQTQFQTSLNTISTSPQMYASARWWSGPQVLGSTEMFPAGGSTMALPSGAVIYIPPSAVPSPSTSAIQPPTVGTTATTTVPTPSY